MSRQEKIGRPEKPETDNLEISPAQSRNHCYDCYYYYDYYDNFNLFDYDYDYYNNYNYYSDDYYYNYNRFDDFGVSTSDSQRFRICLKLL